MFEQMRILILAGAVLATSGTLPPQVPPACVCNLLTDTWPANNIDIGSAVSTGACSVVTGGGTASCQVTGTITLTYLPNGGFQFGLGQWGLPVTNFAAPQMVTTVFNHTGTGTSVPCGQGAVSSFLNISGTLNGNRITLAAFRVWICNTF